MNLIDKILERAEKKCFGVNVLPIDRLHKGTKEELRFYELLIRERREMLATLDTAALLIAERDAELADLRETVKASGHISMSLGAKRDPSKDQE